MFQIVDDEIHTVDEKEVKKVLESKNEVSGYDIFEYWFCNKF